LLRKKAAVTAVAMTSIDVAISWLQEEFAAGLQSSSDIPFDAALRNITEATLKRPKSKLDTPSN
jgi:hypothetical protein